MEKTRTKGWRGTTGTWTRQHILLIRPKSTTAPSLKQRCMKVKTLYLKLKFKCGTKELRSWGPKRLSLRKRGNRWRGSRRSTRRKGRLDSIAGETSEDSPSPKSQSFKSNRSAKRIVLQTNLTSLSRSKLNSNKSSQTKMISKAIPWYKNFHKAINRMRKTPKISFPENIGKFIIFDYENILSKLFKKN